MRLIKLTALALGALLISTASTTSAGAPYPVAVIEYDGGGFMHAFDTRHMEWSRENRYVIVDGPCKSACTRMLLRIVPLNVCATNRGSFHFHKSYAVDAKTKQIKTDPRQREISDAIWQSDWIALAPPHLRKMLERRDIPSPSYGDPTNKMVKIRARHVVPACPPALISLTRSPSTVTVRN